MAETESDAAEAGETDETDFGGIRKAELINMVVAQSGLKKKDVKPAVESTLAVLGKILESGRNMNLPPFGKIKIVKTKDLDKAEVMTLRVRRSTQMKEHLESLETAPEDS